MESRSESGLDRYCAKEVREALVPFGFAQIEVYFDGISLLVDLDLCTFAQLLGTDSGLRTRNLIRIMVLGFSLRHQKGCRRDAKKYP